MKMIKQTLISLTLVLTCAFGVGALAAQPAGAAPKQPATTGVHCAVLPQSICDQANENTGGEAIWGLLIIILNILTAGIGVAAVIGIIIAAIIYSSAEDKADQVHKAKMMIWNIVLGLVLYIAMYAFLQFIIPGGIFS